MFEKNIIPPHCGIKTQLNRSFPPLDIMNMHIASSPRDFIAWPDGDGKRRILLNNFNATVDKVPISVTAITDLSL